MHYAALGLSPIPLQTGHNPPVKRWTGALIMAIVGCLMVLMSRSADPALLQDSDTHVLLAKIQERHAPLSWFAGDWPLENHFYRPIPTLLFEMDHRLYGDHAAGYGWTNALLAVLCVALLFWFLRELTDRPMLTGVATLTFALWHTGFGGVFAVALYYLAWVVGIGGLLRHGWRVWRWLPAPLVALAASTQAINGVEIALSWLPSRTATAMTVFALAAMAAYARYERLGARRETPVVTPLDPPATRSSRQAEQRGNPLPWGLLSVLFTALAFACYEQAVMLPAVLLATACTMRWQGFRVRWGWQAPFWCLLVGYLALRHAVIPSSASGYQLQQFRHGPGVWIDLAKYAFPFMFGLGTAGAWFFGLPLTLFTADPWQFLLSAASELTAFYQARRRWPLALAGWGMAFIAFLPMAWLKQFGHYHYWPLALRSLLVAVLGWLALDLTVSAWSRPTVQAPPRHDPAPGSLPRP